MKDQPRLLFLLPTLGYGGMETRFLTLAEALRSRGGEATFLAAPGALEGQAAATARVRRVDWLAEGRASDYDLVERISRGHTAAFVPCDPMLLHVVPALVSVLPVHLCLHNVPGTFPNWFGESAWARARALVSSLHASGRVALSASSEAQAREHEQDLGLPAGAVAASPNGVAIRSDDDHISSGAIRSVALVTRLAYEKRANAAAAAALVAAGLARGCDVVLEVYGEGPDEAAIKSLLAESLPDGAWRLHGSAARPVDVLRVADVCVGTGRMNVEALVCGRRVVVVKSLDPAGQLGAPVTPSSFDTVASDNFTWRRRDPLDPDDVWDELEQLSAEDVAAVRDRARREYSADAMLDRDLALLADLEAVQTPLGEAAARLVSKLGWQSASLEDALTAAHAHGQAAERGRQGEERSRLAETARREAAEQARSEAESARSEAERARSEAERVRAEAEAAHAAAEQRYHQLTRTRRYRVGAALARPLDALRRLRRG
jgi:hypothetical protein